MPYCATLATIGTTMQISRKGASISAIALT